MALIFTVEFWLTVGFVLSILEIFSGFFIALSFGIAGFILAVLLKVLPELFTEWYEIALIYSVISLLIVFLSRKIFIKSKAIKHDVND